MFEAVCQSGSLSVHFIAGLLMNRCKCNFVISNGKNIFKLRLCFHRNLCSQVPSYTAAINGYR